MVIKLSSHTIAKNSRFVDREFRENLLEVFSRKRSTVLFCLGNTVFRIEGRVACCVLSLLEMKVPCMFDFSSLLKKTNLIGAGGA